MINTHNVYMVMRNEIFHDILEKKTPFFALKKLNRKQQYKFAKLLGVKFKIFYI